MARTIRSMFDGGVDSSWFALICPQKLHAVKENRPGTNETAKAVECNAMPDFRT